jgi:hypothetical protein
MKQFKVIRKSHWFSTTRLSMEVERELKELTNNGYEIISVSFGFNIWWIPTAFITVKREVVI